MTDQERREQIRKRVAAATEGAWEFRRYPPDYVSDVGDVISWTLGKLYTICSGPYRRDGELIAHTPSDLAWLDQQLTQAERERDELQHDYELMRNGFNAAVERANTVERALAEEARVRSEAWRELLPLREQAEVIRRHLNCLPDMTQEQERAPLAERVLEAVKEVRQLRTRAEAAEAAVKRLETAINTFLELHKAASERTCHCRLCQMFRAALAGPSGEAKP